MKLVMCVLLDRDSQSGIRVPSAVHSHSIYVAHLGAAIMRTFILKRGRPKKWLGLLGGISSHTYSDYTIRSLGASPKAVGTKHTVERPESMVSRVSRFAS